MIEVAIQRAILQSSVHIPTVPDLGYNNPQSIALITSEKPYLMIAYPSLLYPKNSVLAPKASQIPKPRSEAMHRFIYSF
jgi:hypothetical protein